MLKQEIKKIEKLATPEDRKTAIKRRWDRAKLEQRNRLLDEEGIGRQWSLYSFDSLPSWIQAAIKCYYTTKGSRNRR